MLLHIVLVFILLILWRIKIIVIISRNCFRWYTWSKMLFSPRLLLRRNWSRLIASHCTVARENAVIKVPHAHTRNLFIYYLAWNGSEWFTLWYLRVQFMKKQFVSLCLQVEPNVYHHKQSWDRYRTGSDLRHISLTKPHSRYLRVQFMKNQFVSLCLQVEPNIYHHKQSWDRYRTGSDLRHISLTKPHSRYLSSVHEEPNCISLFTSRTKYISSHTVMRLNTV